MSQSRFSPSPQFIGQDGKRYKTVGCVLQNNGAGVWQQIGGAHKSMNVLSVTTEATTITVNFNFTASNVVSFVACPDDAFALFGYLFGASVGLSSALITCARSMSLGGIVSYSGSAWTVSGAGMSGAVFNAGVLTITHSDIGGVMASADSRDGVYVPAIGALGATTTEIKFYDYAGTLITTPDTNMKAYFTRTVSPFTVVSPAALLVSGANIWCYGVFEV